MKYADFLEYAPNVPSGLRWKVARGGGVKAGDMAGAMSSSGYWGLKLGGERLLCHRVVWALLDGELPDSSMCIDHINGNKSDNRRENLRTTTIQGNNRNRAKRGSNTSGVTGGI
jgi:hypothetical protein